MEFDITLFRSSAWALQSFRYHLQRLILSTVNALIACLPPSTPPLHSPSSAQPTLSRSNTLSLSLATRSLLFFLLLQYQMYTYE
jgi:hypothetical protein